MNFLYRDPSLNNALKPVINFYYLGYFKILLVFTQNNFIYTYETLFIFKRYQESNYYNMHSSLMVS